MAVTAIHAGFFSKKIMPNNKLAPSPMGLAPVLGNPRSATDCSSDNQSVKTLLVLQVSGWFRGERCVDVSNEFNY